MACPIGDHAIVGTGAVVNRAVPAYAIAAGVPARVIRDRRTLTGDPPTPRPDSWLPAPGIAPRSGTRHAWHLARSYGHSWS